MKAIDSGTNEKVDVRPDTHEFDKDHSILVVLYETTTV